MMYVQESLGGKKKVVWTTVEKKLKIKIILRWKANSFNHLSYIIGHSANSPWQNLKKLMLLASTTAMTIIFFPFFNAANGFGFRTAAAAAGAGDGKAHGNSLRINDGSGVGTTTVGSGGGGGGGAEGGPPIGDRRCRGCGGGASGRT